MKALAVGLGVGVLVARVYLGAHNPLDVVCGAALGVGIGAALNLVFGVPAAGADRADCDASDVVGAA